MTYICLKVALSAAFGIFLIPQLHASTPLLEQVANPPALSPLAATTHSRVLTTPSAFPELGGHDYASQWPGVYFEAAFKGTEVFFRVAQGHEVLHIIIDAQPPLVLCDPKDALYRVSGLEKRAHDISVSVASEHQGAPVHFLGFAIPIAETALPLAMRKRQIEFIGDSHTVGYGNTSPKRECTNEELFANTDDTQAFGPITAARYNADFQINAISGRGIIRNYNGFPADHLPEAYPYLLFDKKQPLADPNWKPQWIVIALGTNDFGTPLNPGEKWKTRDELHTDYEATYVRFLQYLRTRNPSAFILLWATEIGGGDVETEEQSVVATMNALGDKRIAFIPIEHLTFSGCHYHPSVADDKTIADKLVKFIDTHADGWKAK